MNPSLSRIVAAFLLVAFYVFAAPKITEITHDSATGVTTVKWSGIAEADGVIVYRSTEPLDDGSLPFAKTYWFPPGSKEGSLKVKGTGTGHYRIRASNANRAPKGELSEERKVVEKDRNLPSIRPSYVFQDGKTRIVATARDESSRPKFLALLGRKNMESPVQTLAEIPWSKEAIEVPASFSKGFVTVVGSDGHGSLGKPLEWLYWGDKANLHVNGTPSPARNRDIRLSQLHPVAGKPLRLEIRITNRGFKSSSSKVRLTLKAAEATSKIEKEVETEAIAPGKGSWASFELAPNVCGKNIATVQVFCQDDGDVSDNRLEFPLYVTKKPVYFLWYGFANDLETANMAAPTPQYIEDWRRRGALSLPIVSRYADANGNRYVASMKGHDGFQYDELGGTWKPEPFLPALRDSKKQQPNAFQALWHIGASVQEPVRQALKDGTVDLLMVELYYTDGTPQSRKKDLETLERQLDMLIKQGVAEKTIIGLASKTNYKGWNTPESHADFLAEQMRLIRRVAPMMPGVAFFSAATEPVVRRRMDELCKELFLETQQ